MRLAVDRRERSAWGQNAYQPHQERPVRGSEAHLRGARLGERRSEALRNSSRQDSKAREAALRDQRDQTRAATDSFAARRARIGTQQETAEVTEPSLPSVVPAQKVGSPNPSESLEASPDPSGLGLAQAPAGAAHVAPAPHLIATSAAGAQSATQVALSKYGALLNRQSQGASAQVAQRAAPTQAVGEVSPSTQKTESQAPRAVTKKSAPQQAANADKLEQAREIFEQVKVKITPNMRQATIALAPAHLGRVGIKLEMRDSELVAVIRAERPEALSALEENLPELRAMLEEAGITAGEFDLGLGFGEGSDEEEFAGALLDPSEASSAESSADSTHTRAMASAVARGGIDLIA